MPVRENQFAENDVLSFGFSTLELRPWRNSFLTGAAVALISQLYLNVFINDFRISLSVILLPFLLMTIGRQLPTMMICGSTALIVFLFRAVILLLQGNVSDTAIFQVIPGAMFYVFYGILFRLQIRSKRTTSFSMVIRTAFFCDLGANLLEIAMRILLSGGETPPVDRLGVLVVVAGVRTLMVAVLLLLIEQYRRMQVQDAQERRYQNLFVMIAGLKNEIYLMRKNTDGIEQVMGSAYRLHELAEREQLPSEVRNMTLGIARDVHEIKKDYLRIMEGLEATINAEDAEERISFREVLEVLEGMGRSILREKNLEIGLLFDCRDDFMTVEHYALMTILRNLTSNSIEAIAGDRKTGTIVVRERLQSGVMTEEGEKDCYVFEVEDDGPGISEKNLQKIFRMGYSTKFDEKTGNIYRGVGLAGVKQVVQDHFGGTITVESEPGEKTCFRVVIPRDRLEVREKRGTESGKKKKM